MSFDGPPSQSLDWRVTKASDTSTVFLFRAIFSWLWATALRVRTRVTLTRASAFFADSLLMEAVCAPPMIESPHTDLNYGAPCADTVEGRMTRLEFRAAIIRAKRAKSRAAEMRVEAQEMRERLNRTRQKLEAYRREVAKDNFVTFDQIEPSTEKG
jgi:hypothetical protein